MVSGSSAPAVSGPSEIALSAVICTYDRYDLLPGAVESLLEQDAPSGAIEIIVVDNSANPSRAAESARRYADLPNFTYLVEPTPGLAHARNRGTRAARGAIVAFIDDDARAACGWARELLLAHAAYEGRAGIVGIYQKHNWATEKRAALDAWAAHVMAAVAGDAPVQNVVKLGR